MRLVMRSGKLYVILTLIVLGASAWYFGALMTSGDPNCHRVAWLTSDVQAIRWINQELHRDHTTSTAEDIDAFVSALTAASQESTEAAGPRSLLLLDASHRLLVTYFDRQRREEIVIDLPEAWFYYDEKRHEEVDFEGDALAGFIQRMESAEPRHSD